MLKDVTCIKRHNGGQVSNHAMTKTLSTTCSQPKTEHYLEAGFTNKKASTIQYTDKISGNTEEASAHKGVASIATNGRR